MTASDIPYLTVVAVSRNDSHGGNLLRRMQIFVRGVLEQCRRHQLNAELVLVEWNPPPDRPRLIEALSWPVDNRLCQVRIIEVPPETHQRFRHSDQLPLFQMIAKNAGIRRARGQFILATNIDILFSDELTCFLASGHLRKGYMYRVDRYDVPADVPPDAPVETQLEYCCKHVIRIHAREGSRNLLSGDYHAVYRRPLWLYSPLEKMQDCSLIPVIHRSRLYTNGCGDFTLMAREHWFSLRGYPEFEMYSLHLDSLLCYAAHYGGAREQVLPSPMRIYHIEHATGSGWTPEARGKLNERLSSAGISQLAHDQFNSWAIQMRRKRSPIIFNDESWGLANDSLPETNIRKRQAPNE